MAKYVPWLFFLSYLGVGLFGLIFSGSSALDFMKSPYWGWFIIGHLGGWGGLFLFLTSGYALLDLRRSLQFSIPLLLPIPISVIGVMFFAPGSRIDLISDRDILAFVGYFLPPLLVLFASWFVLRSKTFPFSNHRIKSWRFLWSDPINFSQAGRIFFALCPILAFGLWFYVYGYVFFIMLLLAPYMIYFNLLPG